MICGSPPTRTFGGGYSLGAGFEARPLCKSTGFASFTSEGSRLNSASFKSVVQALPHPGEVLLSVRSRGAHILYAMQTERNSVLRRFTSTSLTHLQENDRRVIE